MAEHASFWPRKMCAVSQKATEVAAVSGVSDECCILQFTWKQPPIEPLRRMDTCNGFMTDASSIAVWEGIEVQRSESEAKKRQNENLKLSASVIQRYLDPPANSPFPLEYAYNLLGDVTGLRVLDYGCGGGRTVF